jgi:LCP family protein required for cell wall assembly
LTVWRRWFPVVFFGLALIISIGCGFLATRMLQTGSVNPVTTAVTFFVPTPQSEFGRDRLYVLLLGIDYNYDSKDQEYSAQARSDTIMVAGLDFPTKTVKIVSVPRDMSATVHGQENKINAAFADGGEPYADEVVGSWLGLKKDGRKHYFDRYIVLKINATKELIDAIGGIDVPVTETMDYDDNWGHLHIHFKPGLLHMNGDQAVSYSRFRHDACSDPCRIKRQQQILRITVAKLKADKFNDLTHIAALIGVVNRNVTTNFSDDEKKSLAWHFRDINLADLKADQIAYTDTRQTDAGEVLVPDTQQRARAVAALTGIYVAETPPPAPQPAASVPPGTVHVAVENGSGESGLGVKMADRLRRRGFVVDSVGNADAFNYETTVIREHSRTSGVGELVRVKLALRSASLSPLPSPSPSADGTASPDPTDVTVIVGRDFSAALAAQPDTAPR